MSLLAPLPGHLLDLQAVLIGAGEKVDLVAQGTVVARQHVGQAPKYLTPVAGVYPEAAYSG